MAKPTDPLLDLIFQVLGHAVESITGTNGPLIPFAVIESSNGERTLARFTAGRNPEEARQQARTHVAKNPDCIRYAVASDGIITESGQRSPAILVEAGEQNAPHAFSFIQRFTSTPAARYAATTRNPAIIDQPPLLCPVAAS